MKFAKEEKLRSSRKRTFFILFFSMLLGYLPWYNFSAISGLIGSEVGLTPGQTGTILSAFQLGYVIMVIFTGWLGDRLGEKKIISFSVFFTGFFSLLVAWLGQDYLGLLILRLLTGLSAGGIYVPGMALLSRWFDPRERGKALGGFIAALTLSYALSYFSASLFAGIWGWRMGIILTSLPAIIMAPLTGFFVEDKKEKTEKEEKKKAPEVEPAPQGGIKGPALITAGYLGHMWELYAFWGWIGIYMQACVLALGNSPQEAASLGGQLAGMIVFAGVFGVWFMGKMGDRLGRTKAILICAFSSLLAQFFFGALFGHSLVLVTLAGIWIGFWIIADSPSFSAGLTEMTSAKIRGFSLGLQNALGFSMTVIAPYVFGLLLEVNNPGVSDPVQAKNWTWPFVVLGLGALLAPISAIFLRKIPQSQLMARGRK